jgi:hypothetical protein
MQGQSTTDTLGTAGMILLSCAGNNANTIHYIASLGGVEPGDLLLMDVRTREVVFMERPLEPNMGPSLADVLLCTFESTNAGFSSFSVRKLLS